VRRSYGLLKAHPIPNLSINEAKNEPSPPLNGSMGSRSGNAEFSLFQAPKSLEVHTMTPSGTGKRLEARLQLPQRTAAYQEAFLQSLQRIAKPLEVISSFAKAQRSSMRRASSFSSTPRSSWSSPTAPSASREASGGDLQLLQSTGMLLEANLGNARAVPSNPTANPGTAFLQLHETDFLGLR
jgi:hypothetical protein